ncbi:hypothetical protein KSC_048430 [Ktedonobacter sp. SOSP1-52]|nr:hypothetical protein KSC_048430 [Ktedonobacter sp. SOSP1-52]
MPSGVVTTTVKSKIISILTIEITNFRERLRGVGAGGSGVVFAMRGVPGMYVRGRVPALNVACPG